MTVVVFGLRKTSKVLPRDLDFQAFCESGTSFWIPVHIGATVSWKMPGPNGSWDGAMWVQPNLTYSCDATDTPGALMTLPGIPGQRPCLFNLESDTGERDDIGSANIELVNHLWLVLNQTVMTRYCRNVQSHSNGGCNRSPPKMLGNCNASCALKYWESLGGKGAYGPICGVPGCD